MKQQATELIFILDRSGSMQGLEQDTIGGFNAMLQAQQKQPGACRVTTVLFDRQYELLHDRVKLDCVPPMSAEQYYVRGMTALLDAMGRTVERFGTLQKHLNPAERADQVMVVVITDGMENASQHYSYQQIKHLVHRQRERFGWEFIFLGANMDAIGAASQIGIQADRATNFHADTRGIPCAYQAVSETIAQVRAGMPVKDGWKAKVEQDYKSRG